MPIRKFTHLDGAALYEVPVWLVDAPVDLCSKLARLRHSKEVLLQAQLISTKSL
jgi:hypothetical protein